MQNAQRTGIGCSWEKLSLPSFIIFPPAASALLSAATPSTRGRRKPSMTSRTTGSRHHFRLNLKFFL
jgi:hypothetical protein